MRIHILLPLIIVTMIFWTVIVMSPHLVHVNNCDLLPQFLVVTVKHVQKRKKVVNWTALMIKQVMCGIKLI
jgi:hypothetical protein